MLVGDDKRLSLGVGNHFIQLLAREVGKDRDNHHRHCGNGKIADTPIGHIATQQGNLIAGVESCAEQHRLYRAHSLVEFSIGHLLALKHPEGGAVCKLPDTVIVNLF